MEAEKEGYSYEKVIHDHRCMCDLNVDDVRLHISTGQLETISHHGSRQLQCHTGAARQHAAHGAKQFVACGNANEIRQLSIQEACEISNQNSDFKTRGGLRHHRDSVSIESYPERKKIRCGEHRIKIRRSEIAAATAEVLRTAPCSETP